jgi:Tol biopolymer transport system component
LGCRRCHDPRLTDSVWYTDEYSLRGGISADGRYVTFESLSSTLDPTDTNERWDVFVWDATTGAVTRLSDGAAAHPTISHDGRFVTYSAVRGTDHLYLWDAATGTTTQVTEGRTEPSLAPTISGNGQYVTFHAPRLYPDDTDEISDVVVWNRETGSFTQITDGDKDSTSPAISADGEVITFWSRATNLVDSDTNGVHDIFVWERTA